MAGPVTEQVNIGEIKVTKRPFILTVKNVSTAIAVIIYDPEHKVGGVAHVILPESVMTTEYDKDDEESKKGKYADLAIPELFKQFEEEGGDNKNVTIRIIGGSQLFQFGGGGGNRLNTGGRIAIAVKTALSQLGLTVNEADVGGNKARSVEFTIETGVVSIKPIGGEPYTL